MRQHQRFAPHTPCMRTIIYMTHTNPTQEKNYKYSCFFVFVWYCNRTAAVQTSRVRKRPFFADLSPTLTCVAKLQNWLGKLEARMLAMHMRRAYCGLADHHGLSLTEKRFMWESLMCIQIQPAAVERPEVGTVSTGAVRRLGGDPTNHMSNRKRKYRCRH